MDQVILDHRARIDKNEVDIAEEKRERISEMRRLETALGAFTNESASDRATIRANVTDLQNDSKEYREKLNSSGKTVAMWLAFAASVISIVISIVAAR